MKTTYVYGHGLLYEVDDATGNVTYYHYDSLGSTIGLTDASANITDRFEYSLYGAVTYRTGSTDTPFLYVGQAGVMTEHNGLLYMRARYYSPQLMRFINADPIGFAGGMNWYAYAEGNPMMYTDPTGWCGEVVNTSMGGKRTLDVLDSSPNNSDYGQIEDMSCGPTALRSIIKKATGKFVSNEDMLKQVSIALGKPNQNWEKDGLPIFGYKYNTDAYEKLMIQILKQNGVSATANSNRSGYFSSLSANTMLANIRNNTDPAKYGSIIVVTNKANHIVAVTYNKLSESPIIVSSLDGSGIPTYFSEAQFLSGQLTVPGGGTYHLNLAAPTITTSK